MTRKKPSTLSRKPHKYHVPAKEREYFSENLGLLLQSAVPLGEAFQSLANSTRSRPMKKALHATLADIDSGLSLADALQRAGIVGNQTLALVRLGEQSGNLAENLQIAAKQEEKSRVFRAKVRSALLYPVFVLSLTLVVGLGVAWFLLPRLAATFSQLHVDLPLISKILIQFGTYLNTYGIIAVPLFLAAILLIGYILFGFTPTKSLGQRLLFKLPGTSRLMREAEIAQLGYLMGILLNAGLPITQAVTLLASASNLVHYKKFYRYLAISLDEGYSVKDSLARYPHSQRLLPPTIQQMIIAGERSGSLPSVLLTLGRTYEQKADLTSQNLEVILEPILLIIVWFGVLLVSIAVIIPIYSLVGGLGQ